MTTVPSRGDWPIDCVCAGSGGRPPGWGRQHGAAGPAEPPRQWAVVDEDDWVRLCALATLDADGPAADIVVALREVMDVVIGAGSGPVAPTFDEHDREWEGRRGRWLTVDGEAWSHYVSLVQATPR